MSANTEIRKPARRRLFDDRSTLWQRLAPSAAALVVLFLMASLGTCVAVLLNPALGLEIGRHLAP
jgi:hypothetical protein